MSPSDNTETVRVELDAEGHAHIAEAVATLLEARGIVIRVSEWLGGRLHGIGRRFLGPNVLGGDWQARYQQLVEAALRNAYRIGTLGLDRSSAKQPRRRLSRLVAAASGGASGFFGLPGIAADLPATTCLMMRSIADVARSHGEDIDSPDTRQACIEVFAFGGPELGDEDIDVAYWAIRGSLSHASITLLIRQVAARFGVMLSQKYLTQAVPVMGAAAGTTLNYAFMDYYQKMAQVHFTLRALERRHDPAAVRACFDSLLHQRKEQRTEVLRTGALPMEAVSATSGGREWIGRNSTASSKPAI